MKKENFEKIKLLISNISYFETQIKKIDTIIDTDEYDINFNLYNYNHKSKNKIITELLISDKKSFLLEIKKAEKELISL